MQRVIKRLSLAFFIVCASLISKVINECNVSLITRNKTIYFMQITFVYSVMLLKFHRGAKETKTVVM